MAKNINIALDEKIINVDNSIDAIIKTAVGALERRRDVYSACKIYLTGVTITESSEEEVIEGVLLNTTVKVKLTLTPSNITMFVESIPSEGDKASLSLNIVDPKFNGGSSRSSLESLSNFLSAEKLFSDKKEFGIEDLGTIW